MGRRGRAVARQPRQFAHAGLGLRAIRQVLVTGASGFVGRALLARLARRTDLNLCAGVRRPDSTLPAEVRVLPCPGPACAAHWLAEPVDTLVHCAARVHVMEHEDADALAEYRKVNVNLTLELARRAVAAGARRFVFLSSVKVNGESTLPGQPFTIADAPAPEGAYAQSKFEAEQGLRALAAQTGLEVVIIRVPLVYGPGVRANFRSMLRWLAAGVPLPLGGLHNRRSLVALDNLVDLIEVCIDHPAAANRTLFVSDGEDLSTSDLLRRLAAAMNRPARLLPVPGGWLACAARLLGRGDVHARLCGSLQVDIRETCTLLGWSPPVAVDEALRRTAQDYLLSQRSA